MGEGKHNIYEDSSCQEGKPPPITKKGFRYNGFEHAMMQRQLLAL